MTAQAKARQRARWARWYRRNREAVRRYKRRYYGTVPGRVRDDSGPATEESVDRLMEALQQVHLGHTWRTKWEKGRVA